MENKEYPKLVLTAGMIIGVLLVTSSILLGYVFGASGISPFFSYVITIGILAWGHITYGKKAAALKDTEGTGYSYGQAFGFVFLISVLAGVIVAIVQVVMQHFIDPEFFQKVMDEALKNQMSSGMIRESDIDVVRESMAFMSKWWVQMFMYTFGMAVWGIIVGLFTSAAIRRKPQI